MEYNGRTLSLTPVNITLAEATRLFKVDRAFVIVLEPGDMTRYEFVIMPTAKLVTAIHETGRIEFGNLNYGSEYSALVTRVIGGEPIGRSMMVAPGIWSGEFSRLVANDNPHTMLIFDAFFQEFWQALG